MANQRLTNIFFQKQKTDLNQFAFRLLSEPYGDLSMGEVIMDLLIPIYVDIVPDLYWSLRRYIRSLLGNLQIDDVYVIEFGKRFTKIRLRGKDAQIAQTFLTKLFGTQRLLTSLKKEEEYSGRVVSIDDNEILVDIGISDKDVLISIQLETFLSRILGKVKKIDTENSKLLMKYLGIAKYFPFTVKIKQDIKENNLRKINGDVGERTARLFNRWREQKLERVIVYGATRSQVERALRKSKCTGYIITVERLGFLEHAIVCKKKILATEIIKRIGPFLWGVKLLPFSPRNILRFKQ